MRGTHRLLVVRAPEAVDVLWENLVERCRLTLSTPR